MPQSREKVVRRLEAARTAGAPVVYRHRGRGSPSTAAFVVAMTDRWVVVHQLLQGVILDDVVLVLVDDVMKVDLHPAAHVALEAIQSCGMPVDVFDCAPDVTPSQLLDTVRQRGGLVRIGYDHEGFRWQEVGFIRAVGEARIELHHMNDDATWAEDSGMRLISRMVRVEVGGLYLGAFERFGDPMPPPSAESLERVADL